MTLDRKPLLSEQPAPGSLGVLPAHEVCDLPWWQRSRARDIEMLGGAVLLWADLEQVTRRTGHWPVWIKTQLELARSSWKVKTR